MNSSVVTAPPGQLADLFQQLTERWRAETLYLSSTTEIAMHPA
jgi:hypothetical protein